MGREGALTCKCWWLALSRSGLPGESLQPPQSHWGWSSCMHCCTGSEWVRRVRWHHTSWTTNDLKRDHDHSLKMWGSQCFLRFLLMELGPRREFACYGAKTQWSTSHNPPHHPGHHSNSTDIVIFHLQLSKTFSNLSPGSLLLRHQRETINLLKVTQQVDTTRRAREIERENPALLGPKLMFSPPWLTCAPLMSNLPFFCVTSNHWKIAKTSLDVYFKQWHN